MSATAYEWIVPHTDETDVRRPLLPSEDPFHDVPDDLARLNPGTIIRSRRVRVGFLGLIPQRGLTAWQLAYRSTDLDGRPEVAVTTVVVPRNHDASRPPRLIAYQCAIDAVTDRCFPSYSLRPGARSWGALPQFELMLMASFLERGHVLTIADHEGRDGYFAAPREPGFRTLDGIRAALAFPALGLEADADVALFGYSGGGMASAWAAEMAPTYAPELSIVGAVLGSPVGDPGQAFIKLNGGLNAGLPALVVAGLRHIYPGLDRVISENASEVGIARLDRLERKTTVAAVASHAFNDFDDYLTGPLADMLATPEVLHVFDDLRLGTRVPTCPLFVVQSVNDQIIDIAEVDTQVLAYVEGGADVRYRRDRASEHISLMVLAMPAMIDWVEQRFEGAELDNGTETVTSMALSPRALVGFAKMLGAAAKTLVGRAG